MDEKRYGELLAEHRPKLIETPEEHERLLTLAESLMDKGGDLSHEEEHLLALIVLLVEAYEAHAFDEDDQEEPEAIDPNAPPCDTLRRLMASNGIEVQDIADIFGNPHLTREVLEKAHGPFHVLKREICPSFSAFPINFSAKINAGRNAQKTRRPVKDRRK